MHMHGFIEYQYTAFFTTHPFLLTRHVFLLRFVIYLLIIRYTNNGLRTAGNLDVIAAFKSNSFTPILSFIFGT